MAIGALVDDGARRRGKPLLQQAALQIRNILASTPFSSVAEYGTFRLRHRSRHRFCATPFLCAGNFFLRATRVVPVAGTFRLRHRFYGVWRAVTNEYQAPPLDEAIDESLQAFIAKKKESMPDAWY